MRHSRSELAHQLSRTLGIEKAREVVDRAADALKLPDPIPHKDALLLLERVATEPGLVGICARFAKSRLLLLSDEEDAAGA